MSDDDGLLIVGGGAAAHMFIDAYRQADGGRAVTMVSADDRLPYFRPALTKELLIGEQTEADLPLDEAGWYTGRGVDVRLNCEVSALDIADRIAATTQGPMRWSQCVLATGSSAKPLPTPGADAAGVLSLRSAADAQHVLDTVADGAPVIVIGSGFIGCEVAAGLRARGIDVTMVSQEVLPQQQRLGEAVGVLLGGWLGDLGVTVRGGRTVSSFERAGGMVVAHLDDGSTVVGGHALAATGASPNISLAAAAGLAIDQGVVVDSSMRTEIPGLFAVGDIAFAFNETAGRPLRVEHWGDAEAMGTIAGKVAADRSETWDEVPGFWSTIGGKEIKYVAWGDGFDDVVVDTSASGFTAWYGNGGLTVGVLTFERDDDLEVGRELIRTHAPFRTN
jgi:3-phenylpropionate/trans-cinnamate dioxygenase ferredoxin reductase subunit